MANTFLEKLHPGFSQTIEIEGKPLVQEKSQFQDIKIFDSKRNGRVLVLDDEEDARDVVTRLLEDDAWVEGRALIATVEDVELIDPALRVPQLLVMAPTRELAIQVAGAVHRYGRELGISVLPVYGGQSLGMQAKALSRGVDVVVATPGRALDLMRRRILRLERQTGVLAMIEIAGQVLKLLRQRAAERDIDFLEAAADTENRQPRIHRARDQRQCRRVALRIVQRPRRRSRAEIAMRLDVRRAPGEENPVEGAEPLAQVALA